MKIARFLIAIAVAAISVGLAGAQARLDKVYAIDIKVFEIPPIQSVTSAGPDGKGGISGTMLGRVVTAGFPADPVFIQTDLATAAEEEKMKDAFCDRKYLSRSSCLPDGFSWFQTGSYSLYCREKDLGADSKRTEFHEPEVKLPNRWTRNEFLLTVFPLAVRSGEAELILKFASTARTSPFDPGLMGVLLDQNFKVALGKTALIGFPQFGGEGSNPGGRGTVYVLAVSVREQDIGGL